MGKFLLVEDDESLGSTLQERLQLKGYEITWAKDLKQALTLFKKGPYDLVLLDVGLPDGSGFDFAKEVKNKSRTPMIFITAMSSAQYRLKGYELGAEEFIPKPFHLQELFLRIQHVLQNHGAKKKIKCHDLIIDFESMAVISKDGKKESIPTRDIQLLEKLINSSPRVVSRDELLDSLWGEDKNPTNRTIDNIVVRLRSVLHDDGQLIKSVRGIGYQWLGETQSTNE